MNVMDIFLQKFGMTRYDVSQRTGISQQTLSSANKKDPEGYSGKILMALSQATGISPGEVLDALLAIKTNQELYFVRNWEEMKIAVDSLHPIFQVKGEFAAIIREVKSGQLSDTERLGTELGSHGGSVVLEVLFQWVYNQIKGLNTEEEKIKDKVGRLYDISLKDETTAVLSLKSLKY